MSKFIQIHTLHTVPASNPNRDKEGNVKNVNFCGVPRARLSSQSQKYAARQAYRENAVIRDELASRSRFHWQSLAEKLSGLEDSEVAAKLILNAFNINDGSKLFPALIGDVNLTFLGQHEIDLIAQEFSGDEFISSLTNRATQYLGEVEEAKESSKSDKPKNKSFDGHCTKKELTSIKKRLATIQKAMPGEVALFGRMMASHAETTVDGSIQVADAMGVNPIVKNRGSDGYGWGNIDFFSAVDDIQPDLGAGMIGETRFTSATYYRYANINVTHFRELMGGADHDEMIAEFIRSFAINLPQGFINRFAHQTPPDMVLLELQESCPFNYVNAFQRAIEKPINQDESAPKIATIELLKYRQATLEMYGNSLIKSALTCNEQTESVPLNVGIDTIMSAINASGS